MTTCERCKYNKSCEYHDRIEQDISLLPINDEYEGEDKGLYDDIDILLAKYCADYEV